MKHLDHNQGVRYAVLIRRMDEDQLSLELAAQAHVRLIALRNIKLANTKKEFELFETDKKLCEQFINICTQEILRRQIP